MRKFEFLLEIEYFGTGYRYKLITIVNLSSCTYFFFRTRLDRDDRSYHMCHPPSYSNGVVVHHIEYSIRLNIFGWSVIVQD